MDRNETIERVRARREPWDIVVIGGGATGVGCALDAASRAMMFSWSNSTISEKALQAEAQSLYTAASVILPRATSLLFANR